MALSLSLDESMMGHQVLVLGTSFNGGNKLFVPPLSLEFPLSSVVDLAGPPSPFYIHMAYERLNGHWMNLPCYLMGDFKTLTDVSCFL